MPALPALLSLLALLAPSGPSGEAVPCPPPEFTTGVYAWYRGLFLPPEEVPSQTVCERAGGSLYVMKRSKAGVEAYVCAVERTLDGPDVERELRSERDAQAGLLPSERKDPALVVARRRIPFCPLRGKLEARVSGPEGARSVRATCIASVAPKDWCVEPRAVPGPHGKGCLRRVCPAGLEDLEFRGSNGGCIFCPAGRVDLKETLALDPGLFERASGLPFVEPSGATWLCRAAVSMACRAPPGAGRIPEK